jgi:malonyl CoA-acyl carrier protein transacylase
MGHSVGEYAALVAAGSLRVGDAARALALRGRSMQAAAAARSTVGGGELCMQALLMARKPNGPDAAAVLLASCEAASEETGLVAAVAAVSSPAQIVLSGHSSALELAVTKAKEAMPNVIRKSVRLPVSAPFHSPIMRPAAEALFALLRPRRKRTDEERKADEAAIDAKFTSNDPVVDKMLRDEAKRIKRAEEEETASSSEKSDRQKESESESGPTVRLRPLQRPLVSNVSAVPETDPARIVQLLIDGVTQPVRWEQSVYNAVAHLQGRPLDGGAQEPASAAASASAAAGQQAEHEQRQREKQLSHDILKGNVAPVLEPVFLELGPGNTLSTLVKQCFPPATAAAGAGAGPARGGAAEGAVSSPRTTVHASSLGTLPEVLQYLREIEKYR